MRILATLLHLYSYLFHLLLSLFLGGIALVGWLTGSTTFDLEMIPWFSGQRLVKWLLGAAGIGLLAVILAVTGKLRSLLAVWAMVVLGVVIYGYFLSSYSYEGMDEFQSVLWYTGAAALAFVGALSQARRRKGKKPVSGLR
jgi:hypothetical protein